MFDIQSYCEFEEPASGIKANGVLWDKVDESEDEMAGYGEISKWRITSTNNF